MIGEVQATQPLTMASEPVSIFFSYSRKDEALMRELESHLATLRRSNLISSWHDGCIIPGEEWEPQIKENLAKAKIILLLISVDFINSDYCYEVELTKAVERHTLKEAHVIPVILRDCDWQDLPIGDMCLGDLQALPKDALPIDDWTSRDKAFANIARGIRKTITQVQQEQEAEAERQRQEAEAALRRQREQEEAEQKRQEAEAQRQREEAERHRKLVEYYNTCHLSQGKLAQSIANVTQTDYLGHPETAQKLAEAQQQKQATEDDLSSEKGIDYTRLRDLLKAQDWKTADRETYEVMIRAVGKKSGDWFTSNELLNFPCADLLTIDRLWVKYSKGRFGFSVQKQIYVECGAKLDGQYPGDTIWSTFGDKVGWRVNGSWIYYSEVTFSTSAPQGHLPCACPQRGADVAWGGGVWLAGGRVFSRIETCKV
jgi:hypothetical protein